MGAGVDVAAGPGRSRFLLVPGGRSPVGRGVAPPQSPQGGTAVHPSSPRAARPGLSTAARSDVARPARRFAYPSFEGCRAARRRSTVVGRHGVRGMRAGACRRHGARVTAPPAAQARRPPPERHRLETTAWKPPRPKDSGEAGGRRRCGGRRPPVVRYAGSPELLVGLHELPGFNPIEVAKSLGEALAALRDLTPRLRVRRHRRVVVRGSGGFCASSWPEKAHADCPCKRVGDLSVDHRGRRPERFPFPLISPARADPPREHRSRPRRRQPPLAI